VLGAEHPLARADAAVQSLRSQLTWCPVFALAVAVGGHVTGRPTALVVAISGLVEAGLATALLRQRHLRRWQARALVADGRQAAGVRAVREEARRLADPHTLGELASRLTRALDSSRRWETTAPASRPPIAIRELAVHAAVVEEIVDRLRQPPPPCVRSIARLEQILDGGYGSPLYCADPTRLREELSRITFEFRAGEDGEGGIRTRERGNPRYAISSRAP
jgi:hypothetical protein